MQPLHKKIKVKDITELIQSWIDELQHEESLETFKQKLQKYKKEYQWTAEYAGPTGRYPGHRQYDALIEKIFNATSSAMPKEQLLSFFMNELQSKEMDSNASCFFVLEAIQLDKKGDSFQYHGLEQRGLDSKHWKNYCKTVLSTLDNSEFFYNIIIKAQSIDLWHSDYLQNYQGELNSLFRSGKKNRYQKKAEQAFWISALPLPAAGDLYPSRALFMLYPTKGVDSYRLVPAGASQESRCLHFLGIAYQQLEHQLRNVAEQVFHQRNLMLTTLAPGLINHEIGHQTNTISDLIQLQRKVVKRLLKKPKEQDLKRLIYQISLLEKASQRLYQITDAFNNIEKQSTGEKFNLLKVLQDAKQLCYHRLGNCSVDINWSDTIKEITLFSDPALLLHLLINLITNAANAFENDSTSDYLPTGRMIYISAMVLSQNSPKLLKLCIENNGPEIELSHQLHIFEKGFTTTSQHGWHGQGLNICRLIAQYLGGELDLIPTHELQPTMRVGFELTLLKKIPVRQDLGRNR